MQHPFMKYAAAAALATGLVFAQAPASEAPAEGAQAHQGRRGFAGGHLQRLAQTLNLTDSQKQQAQTIFKEARQSAQPLRQQLKQNREALSTAAKAGNSEAQIQQLANEQGRMLGQMVAIRTEASSKFYQLLTPEQRVKA